MLWKELTQVSNRKRFVVQKAAVAVGASLLFIFVAGGFLYGTHPVSFEAVSRCARNFAAVWALGSTLVLSAAALVFSASIVVDERTHKRLPLLIVAEITPGTILGAKALSILARTATGVVVSLPVLVMVAAFGGIEAKTLVVLAAIVLSNVWFYGCIGLVASAIAPTLLWALALAVGAVIAHGALLGAAEGSLPSIEQYMGALGVMGILDQTFSGGTGWYTVAGGHIIVNLLLGSLLFIFAAAVFRSTATSERRQRWEPWRLSSSPRRRAADAKYRAEGFGHGVLAKEIVSRRIVFTLLPVAIIVLVWAWFLLRPWSGIYSGRHPFDLNEQCGMLTLEAGAVLLILSLRAAVLVAREKELRTLELLILSRLGRLRILAGKAAAALVEQAPGLFVLLLHVLLVLWAWYPYRSDTILLLPYVPIAVVFSTALGLYFGLAAKHVVTAVSLTAFIWFFGATVGPGVMMSAENILGPADLNETALLLFGVASAAAALAVLRFARRGGYGSWLPALAYCLIAAEVAFFAEAAFVEGHSWDLPDVVGRTWVLPVSGLADFARYRYDASPPLAVFFIQGALVAWMAISGLAGFEAQARRA